MSRLTMKNERGEFYPRRYKDGYGNTVVLSNEDCFDKLGHYEDLEEQGRLIELPCKIGDYVYKIHNNDWKTYFRGEGKELGIIKSVFTYKDIPGIGTLVFLTKEEAEAKLAEVKGK